MRAINESVGSPAKVSKESVNYRMAGTDGGGESAEGMRRCGTCSMFLAPGACTLVSGIINPAGVCDRWEPVNTGSEGYTVKRSNPTGGNHEMGFSAGSAFATWVSARRAGSVSVLEFSNDCHDEKGEFCSGGGEGRLAVNKSGGAGEGPQMNLKLLSDQQKTAIVARQSAVPGFEDVRIVAEKSGVDAAIKEIVDRQAAFIEASAERSLSVSPEATELHAGWYPFASKWTGDLADKYGISHQAMAGLTAVLSPGADWSHNVAWANNIAAKISENPVVSKDDVDAYYLTRLAAWDKKVQDAGKAGKSFDIQQPGRPLGLEGKKLSELSNGDVAIAIRGMSDRDPIMQLGGHAGFGDPKVKAIPQSDANLTKAVSIMRDGSLENIDRSLGEGHKVRSFYNNILNPADPNHEVTVDTHHYGVANGHPWGISSPFIASGSKSLTAAPSNAKTGATGTYALVVQATRQATDAYNSRHGTSITPNQMQSIVWEQHRSEFPSKIRADKNMVNEINAARSDRATGKIGRDEETGRVEAARLKAGGPTIDEQKKLAGYDLRGEARPALGTLRKSEKGGKK